MNGQNDVFKNLKVIDLTTVLAGPSVGTFFAELGADVLKIENPVSPDVTRSWKLPQEDKSESISAYFSSINYMKKYIYLHLKKENEKFLQFISEADVLLMNFKLGDQEKLQITDAILRTINPQLIIGKINGFGNKNDRVAYDLILQAETGFMSMNGTPESGPVKMPIALIDVLTAHHLKEGILIELYQKLIQGENYKGKTVNVSLYEAAVCSLVNQASNYLMTNHVPQRIGSLHPNIAPYGELFTTQDEKVITFAIGSNKHFFHLCDFLQRKDLIDSTLFNTNQNRVAHREKLFPILQSEIKKHHSTAIFDFMHFHYVPCGEIKNLKEVFESPLAQNLIKTEIIDNITTKRVSSIAFSIEE